MLQEPELLKLNMGELRKLDMRGLAGAGAGTEAWALLDAILLVRAGAELDVALMARAGMWTGATSLAGAGAGLDVTLAAEVDELEVCRPAGAGLCSCGGQQEAVQQQHCKAVLL
jgi:hypothetical protein